MDKKGFILMFIALLVFNANIFARRGAGVSYRLGGGVGYNYYIGNQMDYELTSNFGNLNENRTGQNIGFYKTINDQWELGGFLRNTSMMTLKSENTQGIECFFQDAQFTAQHSFNDNVDLSNSFITINATMGLGFILYKSRYFVVNPLSESISHNISTIGYGIQNGTDNTLHDPEKRLSITGHAGLNIGFRISRSINFYIENNFNLTTTNKLSGNLYKKSFIPTDGYWYSGVAIYLRFGRKAEACPRFY